MNCPFCDRETPEKYQEKHHLTPRCKKGKETVPVCIDCGNQIHELFSISELNSQYDTVEKLKNHPGMQKWIRWVRKRPFGICIKRKKKK
jgi:hypothetical protein